MQATTLLMDIAESAVNRYLALDPEISQQLGQLEGRCIAIELTLPELTIFCFPRAGALTLQAGYDDEPDCHLKGSVSGFMKMIRSDNPAEVLSSGEVSIIGESRIAQDFSDTLSRIDIDWEEMLSKITGDFTAHRIGTAIESGRNWLMDGVRALQGDTTEYFQEESGILPTAIEVNRFIQDVDVLRDDVERLEARIRRLERES